MDQKNLIENCKKLVKARIEFYNQLKKIYDPSRDKQDSYTWGFMHSLNMEQRKVSPKYIEEYHQKYKINLPKLLISVFIEVGSGGFINTNLISPENKLYPPIVCMEKDFLDKCLEAKIVPSVIEDGVNEFYDFENNSFTHVGIQKVYSSLDSNRDEYLAILFYVGHDGYIVLNRGNKMKVVVHGVEGVTSLPFYINGTEYHSPYFKHFGVTLDKVICPLNEGWWLKMKGDILKLNLQT